MKTVLAFGTFDLIHPGHIAYLGAARRLGDKLIVIVARDDSVRMLKKREPFLDEDARCKIVDSLKMVDRAVLGNKLKKPSDIYNIFKKYRPDVIAIGYDQKANIPAMKEWLVRNKIKAKVVKLKVRINDDVYKSSKLLSRLNK